MLKILLYVPIWQRPEITRLHMQNVRRLVEYNPQRYHITPFYVVSEDWAETMCSEFGYPYHRTENSPLGRKLNEGLKQFINDDFDWLLTLGSDDFVEPEFLDDYLPYFQSRPIFAPKVVNMINATNGMVKACRVDRGCWGALRCISWELLRWASFDGEQFIGIWSNAGQRGMDYTSAINIHDRTGHAVMPAEIETKVFDLKTDLNINKFHEIEGTVFRARLEEMPKELHYLFGI